MSACATVLSKMNSCRSNKNASRRKYGKHRQTGAARPIVPYDFGFHAAAALCAERKNCSGGAPQDWLWRAGVFIIIGEAPRVKRQCGRESRKKAGVKGRFRRRKAAHRGLRRPKYYKNVKSEIFWKYLLTFIDQVIRISLALGDKEC